MRKSFQEHLVQEVKLIAEQGTCPRLQVGGVLFNEDTKRILLKSYNGSPSGCPHCDEVGCLMVENHCMRAEHAERNLLYTASAEGISTKKLSVVVSHFPCHHCYRGLVQAGIKNIYYIQLYGSNTEEYRQYRQDCKIKVKHISELER